METKKQLKEILLISAIITLIFCIPFFSGMINVGSDTCFHMNRIEALRTAICNGDFYPYIFHYQNYYFGYAIPIFYCNLFLYPAAVLSIFLSVYDTWAVYIAMIIFMASVSIQYALINIKKNPKFISKFFVAFLYLMNFAILTRAFKRGALGELLALIFVPYVILNIKRVVFDKEKCWIKLGFSFTFLLLAHNITFITMVITFGVILLIKIRSVIKDKTYITVLKGTVLALLLSLFYLLPMLEQLQTGIYYINNYFENTISGSSITELLSWKMSTEGGYHENSIMIALVVVPLFLLKNKEYRWLSIAGLIVTLISTEIFPWQYLGFIGFIQFTNRLLIISMPFLAIASGIVVDELNVNNKAKTSVISIALLLSVLTATNGIYVLRYKFVGTITKETTEYDIANDTKICGWNNFYSVTELSTPEYLPVEPFNYYEYSWQMTVSSNKMVYSLVNFDYNSAEFEIEVLEGDYDYVYPKTYYKGYEIDIYDEEGNYLETVEAELLENRAIGIHNLDEYASQTIVTKVVYRGTWIQKITMGISLITLLMVILYVLKRKTESKSIAQINQFH